MDPTLERVKNILEIADRDFATTKEVAEIIDALIAVIKEAKPEAVRTAIKEARQAAEVRIGEVMAVERKNLDDIIQAVKLRQGPPGAPGKPGENGKPGSPGRPGMDATVDYEYIIERVLSDMTQPEDGEDGKSPDHEWDGTKIRFQKPSGSWGPWVDLQGMPGPGSYSLFGHGSPGGLERVFSTSGLIREGVSDIYFGSNLTVTRTSNGVRVDAAAGGGSSANVTFEKVTGAQSGSNVTLDLTTLAHTFVSILFVTRQGQVMTPTTDYSISGNTVTILNADAASEVYLVQYTY